MIFIKDEIGRLVRDVCHRVPHGILVFLPSYKMLDNMCQRWQSTGTWADIQEWEDKKFLKRYMVSLKIA